MIKLYKKSAGVMYYWEVWKPDNYTAIFHYGILGTRGKTDRVMENNEKKNLNDIIKREIQAKRDLGFEEIPDEEHKNVIVEYRSWGIWSLRSLKKRHRTEEYLDQQLGWHGVGFVDGGSNSERTYDICCCVVDAEIAKLVIKRCLRLTKYFNYKRIYLEE